ncbi:DUF742 domain-containing protein [Streptomyces sp. NPDC048483]|uniref:DUF742 domain-containing protein n=1 Tax=Streptomyces sp. NPDC048483 TaxID=3154927 RepID=UPI00343C1CC8
MSDSHQDGTEEWPERLYVITSGRSSASNELDLVTLIVARTVATAGMQPEHVAILNLCQTPLSIAEISAHIGLPVSVVTVLISDLLDEQQVLTRPPVPPADLPDLALIEKVIHGLQKL